MMKFTKTFLGLAVVAALSFSLAACGGGGANSGGGDSATSTESSGGGSASGETIDSGAYTATCPAGFMNIPQTDVFGEQDEDGNFPTNPKLLMFSYGAESEWDAFSKPAVNIALEDEGVTFEDSVSMYDWFYENIEEKTFNIGGTDYKGIEADYDMSLSDDDDPELYHYQIVYVEDGGRLFNVSIITSNPDTADTGLNVDNADVQTIIKSIKLK